MKPKLGQEVCILPVGNALHKGEKPEARLGIVSKVGRKYFTVVEIERSWIKPVFYIDTWREKTEYSQSYKVYKSLQAWRDEKETNDISRLVSNSFEYGKNKNNLSIDALRAIKRIIDANSGEGE